MYSSQKGILGKSFLRRELQTLTLKVTLVQGNNYCRTCLVTLSFCITHLVTPTTCLTIHSTRSTHQSVLVPVYSRVMLVCPLLVLVCPVLCPSVVLACLIIASVCPLIVFILQYSQYYLSVFLQLIINSPECFFQPFEALIDIDINTYKIKCPERETFVSFFSSDTVKFIHKCG